MEYIPDTKAFYQRTKLRVKIGENGSTELISVRRGVIEKTIFSQSSSRWKWRKQNWDRRSLKIDGRYLNHLRFADDIVLIGSKLD